MGDVTALARKTLGERLADLPDVEAAGGVIVCAGIEKVEGDASKPVIRGKLRHLFDLSFHVKFTFRWMNSSGQQKANGHLKVADFTNDAFEIGGTEPSVQLSFKEGVQKLEANRRQAVEAALGTWPATKGTLMGHV